MTNPFAHVDDEGRPSDSVGQAWQGKAIPTHGFSDDRGEAESGETVPTARGERPGDGADRHREEDRVRHESRQRQRVEDRERLL